MGQASTLARSTSDREWQRVVTFYAYVSFVGALLPKALQLLELG
jgi:hypothetical protein